MSSSGTATDRVLARTDAPRLAWLHIGDLHLAEAGAENHRDLGRIVALANALPAGSLDFAVLPGDHDFKPGNLQAYDAVLGPNRNGKQW